MTRRTGLDGTGLPELSGHVWRTYPVIISRPVRSVDAVALLLALGACAQRGAGGTPEPTGPSATLPDDADALVLQVAYVGGFVTPETTVSRLPVVSVYADGRVITEGPTAAIYPGFAWPNVQVHRIAPQEVQRLVDDAFAAGVADTEDLGMPPLADVPSTRFTVTTATETYVREVYGLVETPPDSGLTPEQEEARAALRGLADELTGSVDAAGDAYVPEAVAAIVRPWADPADGLEHPAAAWPGPALPGEPTGALPDLTCVTAEGDQAAALRAAAADANVLTPWTSPDGARWSVTFRPLLPHETGCADLVA
jgi:hypothetical protein